MADEDTDKEKDEGQAGKAGPSTMKIVIIAVVASLILSGAMVGGAMMFMGGDAEATAATEGEEVAEEEAEEKKLGPPQYHSMDPKFVISFSDQRRARFMQFSLQLMTRDNEVMKMLDAHMPAIRSSLLMLFGSQKYEDMITREGKQKLLKDIVEDVNATLAKLSEDEDGETGVVNEAYFDSFVIQ